MGIVAYIIFFLIFLGLVCIFIYYKNRQLTHKDNLDVFMIFTVAFFVYSSIGAFDQVAEFSSDIYVPFLFYVSVALGYITFSVGYITNLKKFDNSYTSSKITFGLKPDIIQHGCVRKDDFVMLAILLFFCIINFSTLKTMVTSFGIGASYSQNMARAARSATTGPLALFNSYFLLLLAMYPFYRVWRTSKVTVFDVFLLVIASMYCVTSGYRSALVLIALAILVIFNNKHRYIQLWKLLIVGVVSLFLLVLIGHLRKYNTISDMREMLSGGGAELFALTSSGEFRNPIATFYNNARAISDGTKGFNFGYSYIVDFLVWIPYAIFPNRPLPWSEQYMREFYPYAKAGTGHGWYILNDGYMAFGVIGAALEMFFIGMVLAKLYKYFAKHRNSPIHMVMYVILLHYVFTMVRTGFLITVKNYILQISLFVVAIVIANDFKIYKNRNIV